MKAVGAPLPLPAVAPSTLILVEPSPNIPPPAPPKILAPAERRLPNKAQAPSAVPIIPRVKPALALPLHHDDYNRHNSFQHHYSPLEQLHFFNYLHNKLRFKLKID